MWKEFSSLMVTLCLAVAGFAQADTIKLKNAAFEDFPRYSEGIKGWIDCGFTNESPPDVQPFMSLNATWGQLQEAYEGKTYLGMVVRDNDTYERVCQRLLTPIVGGQCYAFSIHLSSSDHYMSPSHKTGSMANYVKPAVLRIWGGNEYCDRRELLGESPTISNKYWRRYEFEFHPTGSYSYIMLEAFYKTPTLMVYNGNVLVDGASDIVPIECPDSEPMVAVIDVTLSDDIALVDVPPTKNEKVSDETKKEVVKKTQEERPKAEPPVVAANPIIKPKPPKERILKNLDRSKLVRGQVIRIENLYFEADTASIDTSSYDVLEEVAYFLSKNKDVIVEIGGHTNGRPPHEYCDKLSTERAMSVADYIKSRGVTNNQVKYKGYGKRKPLASNKTKWGRERNQRVELRILNFDS